MAHASDPLEHYETAPDSGYSVDNLSPPAVKKVAAVSKSTGNYISWEESDAPDLSHYEVHKGESEDFTPGKLTLVGTTIETHYLDKDGETDGVFYKIVACDFSWTDAFTEPCISREGVCSAGSVSLASGIRLDTSSFARCGCCWTASITKTEQKRQKTKQIWKMQTPNSKILEKVGK